MENTKYRIIETQGCILWGVTVNDKDLVDLTEDEQDEVVDYLLQKTKEQYKAKELDFMSIVGNFHYTDYKCDRERCGCCGDTVSTTTWDI